MFRERSETCHTSALCNSYFQSSNLIGHTVFQQHGYVTIFVSLHWYLVMAFQTRVCELCKNGSGMGSKVEPFCLEIWY